jgi:hypothetical protein
LDLTPGDGTFAKCAIEKDLVYVGIVMTDKHGETLKQNLIAFILEQMAVEGSEMYDVRYALYKKGTKTDGAKDPPEPKAGTKNKGKTSTKEPKKKKAQGRRGMSRRVRSRAALRTRTRTTSDRARLCGKLFSAVEYLF